MNLTNVTPERLLQGPPPIHWELTDPSPGNDRTWVWINRDTCEILTCARLNDLLTALEDFGFADRREIDRPTRLAFLTASQQCLADHRALTTDDRSPLDLELGLGARPGPTNIEEIKLVQAVINNQPNDYGDTHWLRFNYFAGWLADYGWNESRGAATCYQD